MAFPGCSELQYTKFICMHVISRIKKVLLKMVFCEAGAVGFQMVEIKKEHDASK